MGDKVASAPDPAAAGTAWLSAGVIAGAGAIVLGDFRIVSKLGEGGMGVVYKAHQLSLDRDVAIKILASRLAENQEFIDRFYREAKASGALDHPNIVKGVLAGEDHGNHCFVMEFVRGQTLETWLKGSGQLRVSDAAKVTLEIARTLEHAEKHRIVHRDIKPSNIMITPDGEVKLLDLGLAKVMDDDSGPTQVGEMAGTLAYVAPEQARNAKAADGRSDIYALGATLYVVLTGEKPFHGNTPFEVLEAKERGKFEPASVHNPAVPERLDDIIKKMMAPAPARRFQSATELIADLESTGLASAHLRLDEATEVTDGRTLNPSRRRPSQSRRVFTVSASTALALILVGLAYWVWHRTVQPPSAQPQGAEPARGSPVKPEGGPVGAIVSNVEPVDVILAHAIELVTGQRVVDARQTLGQGLAGHPADPQIERLLRELEHGVLLLFQYQTPEETSPIVPLLSADEVTLTRQDNYRFAMVLGRECFIYAYQRDARPSVTRIFPNSRYSPDSNPLAAGQLRWLPDVAQREGASWLHLDTSVGEERVYFVGVTKPLRDPESFGQQFVSDPDGFRQDQDMMKKLESFLQPGPAGEPCFANNGPVQVFRFNHK